jgi:hypothetical protein
MGGRVRGGDGGSARHQHESDQHDYFSLPGRCHRARLLVVGVVAIGRGRPLADLPSEWDEGIVLGTESAGAQLIARHLDNAT